MIVVDASAALSSLLNAGLARDMVGSDQIHVPHLIDSELANGLRRMARAGDVDASAAWVALRTWQRLGVIRYPVLSLLGRVWDLRNNLSAYDASYVALAESLDCSLVTADARLGGASGIRCPVTVVPAR